MSEKIDRLIEEIGGVRNAVEELYLVLEYAWRNRDELATILNLERIPERKTLIPESVTCYECDAQADSLQEALINGWSELSADQDGLSWNFLGTCPACEAEHEEEFYRLNPHVKRDAPTEESAEGGTTQGSLF